VNALAISIIRTYVPIGVGALVTWLLTIGLEIDAEGQAGLIIFGTGLLQAVYYAGVRALETRFPAVGVLLGVTKSPDSYSKGTEEPQAVAGPATDVPASEDVVLPDLTVDERPVNGL